MRTERCFTPSLPAGPHDGNIQLLCGMAAFLTLRDSGPAAVRGGRGLRCFRPFPSQRTLAPAPSVTSLQFRLVSSETRRPAWTASSVRARSRRPSQRA